jgi:hypothetical protein
MVIVKGKISDAEFFLYQCEFHLAPKKEEAANNAALVTDNTPPPSAQKPAANTQQQQVAIPRRKRRDRIPERPNYRFFLLSIYD